MTLRCAFLFYFVALAAGSNMTQKGQAQRHEQNEQTEQPEQREQREQRQQLEQTEQPQQRNWEQYIPSQYREIAEKERADESSVQGEKSQDEKGQPANAATEPLLLIAANETESTDATEQPQKPQETEQPQEAEQPQEPEQPQEAEQPQEPEQPQEAEQKQMKNWEQFIPKAYQKFVGNESQNSQEAGNYSGEQAEQPQMTNYKQFIPKDFRKFLGGATKASSVHDDDDKSANLSEAAAENLAAMNSVTIPSRRLLTAAAVFMASAAVFLAFRTERKVSTVEAPLLA